MSNEWKFITMKKTLLFLFGMMIFFIILAVIIYLLINSFFSYNFLFPFFISVLIIIFGILFLFFNYYFDLRYLINSYVYTVSTIKYLSKPDLQNNIYLQLINNIEKSLGNNDIIYMKNIRWNKKIFPTITIFFIEKKKIPIKIIKNNDINEVKISVGYIFPLNKEYFDQELKFILEKSIKNIIKKFQI